MVQLWQLEATLSSSAMLRIDRHCCNFSRNIPHSWFAPDGTVVAAGESYDDSCRVSSWKNIVAVSAGLSHTVGLCSDGTVVAVGTESFNDGQCNVSDWKDIIDVSAGAGYTLGLRSDGTVVAVGNNQNGRSDVKDWKDIVAISAGMYSSIGLRSDGTVVSVGSSDEGQCAVGDWKNIRLPWQE